jgi:hypothetical protein
MGTRDSDPCNTRRGRYRYPLRSVLARGAIPRAGPLSRGLGRYPAARAAIPRAGPLSRGRGRSPKIFQYSGPFSAARAECCDRIAAADAPARRQTRRHVGRRAGTSGARMSGVLCRRHAAVPWLLMARCTGALGLRHLGWGTTGPARIPAPRTEPHAPRCLGCASRPRPRPRSRKWREEAHAASPRMQLRPARNIAPHAASPRTQLRRYKRPYLPATINSVFDSAEAGDAPQGTLRRVFCSAACLLRSVFDSVTFDTLRRIYTLPFSTPRKPAWPLPPSPAG